MSRSAEIAKLKRSLQQSKEQFAYQQQQQQQQQQYQQQHYQQHYPQQQHQQHQQQFMQPLYPALGMPMVYTQPLYPQQATYSSLQQPYVGYTNAAHQVAPAYAAPQAINYSAQQAGGYMSQPMVDSSSVLPIDNSNSVHKLADYAVTQQPLVDHSNEAHKVADNSSYQIAPGYVVAQTAVDYSVTQPQQQQQQQQQPYLNYSAHQIPGTAPDYSSAQLHASAGYSSQHMMIHPSLVQQGLGEAPVEAAGALAEEIAPPPQQLDRKKNCLPMHGNASTFNINSLLHRNILESEYFQNLFQLETYHEVLREISARVTHVEPWQTGTSRIPSTASCLLLKLMHMQLTVKQMTGLLTISNSDHYSPHARAIGFLYLRYTCPPGDLYSWFAPHLEDPEEFFPGSDEVSTTMGDFVWRLLTEMQYFGTTLPRIPVLIERALRVALLLVEDRQRRRRSNMKNLGAFVAGAIVRAVYSDPENEPAFYDAVIDSVEDGGDWEGFDGVGPRYWVTYSEHGNTECVDLGDLEVSGGDADGRGARERSRSRDRDGGNLMDKVMQSSREASAAVGKNYAKRVATYKGSLSMKMDRHTARAKSRSRSPEAGAANRGLERSDKEEPAQSAVSKPAEVSRERLEEMKRLKERYA